MNLNDLDLAVVRYVNAPFSPELAYLAIGIIYSVYAYLIILAYFFFRKRRSKRLFHLFVTAVIGYIFVASLKFIISRPRPYEAHQEIRTVFTKVDPSFPSSHAFIAYLSFCFIPKEVKGRLKHLLILYLLVLIPLSLLYVGVHYPSDVIVGALIGLIIPRLISEKLSASLLQKVFKLI